MILVQNLFVGAFSSVAGPEWIIPLIVFLGVIFPIWMIVDCLRRESSAGNDKLIWLLVIILAPLGSLIYFFARKLSRPLPTARPPDFPG